jgi:thiosulfate sulfurtransferase
MDVEGRFSISPQSLYIQLGTELAPIVVDVRRSPAFEADDTVIAGAVRRLPEEVDHWRSGLPEARSVVVYCAHGQEVSQNAAAALRAAGAEACYVIA